jgi:hypothetical protein
VRRSRCSTRCPTISVIAEYIDEGLLRDIDAIFGAGDGPGDPPSTKVRANKTVRVMRLSSVVKSVKVKLAK